MKKQPSIYDVVRQFGSEERCIAHLEKIRWPKKLACIKCGSVRVFKFDRKGKTGKVQHLYECVDCRYQFSVTTGTIFHDSHLPLTKWFLAIYLICSARKGVSAKQLQRELALGSYETAWYMAHRIRLAMKEDSAFCRKFSGVVEVDETYVGGRKSGKAGRGSENKIPVVGIRERTSGHIRLQAIKVVSGSVLAGFIRRHAIPGTVVHTDQLNAYRWLDSSEFAHRSVNHTERYVDGDIHTNGVENVWSLFKRAVIGVFHKVSDKYLPLYLDEFSYRFNHRDDVNLMDRVLTTCG